MYPRNPRLSLPDTAMDSRLWNLLSSRTCSPIVSQDREVFAGTKPSAYREALTALLIAYPSHGYIFTPGPFTR